MPLREDRDDLLRDGRPHLSLVSGLTAHDAKGGQSGDDLLLRANTRESQKLRKANNVLDNLHGFLLALRYKKPPDKRILEHRPKLLNGVDSRLLLTGLKTKIERLCDYH